MRFQKNLNNSIIGPSKKYSVPIQLDPEYYEGAIVYGDDGRLYFSNGTEWNTPAVDLPDDVWRGEVDLDSNEDQSLLFPRKTTSETNSFVGENGEITIDTTKNSVVVHDGSTAGGSTLVSELASQTISNKTLNLQDTTIVGLNGFGLSLSGDQLGIDDSVVLTTSDNQTITGIKTFDEEVRINDSGGIRTNQASFNLIPQNAADVNFATGGTNISIGSGTGQTTINHDLVVGKDLIVNGDTFTTSTDVITLDDKVLSLLDLADSGDPEPTDSLANGGGIELNGTTIKEFKWFNVTEAWTSSENIDIPADKSYLIDGDVALAENTLGTSITGSSLESVGILTSGRWEADTIETEYGGTGQTTYIDGQLLIGNTVGNTLEKARLSEGDGINILNGNGQIEISNGDRGSLQNIFKNIVDENDNIQFSATSNNDALKFEGTGTTSITFDSGSNAIIIDTPDAVLIPGDGITVSSNEISVDETVVRTDGNQTISGTKSFNSVVDANITGNAGTATALQNAVTINGVSFDGTENITVSTTTDEVLTAGDGISGGTFNGSTAVTFDNTDKGSDQNVFKNITDENDSTQFSADNNNDSLKFVAGIGTQINFDSTDNSLTFISTGEEIEEPDIFKNIADSTGSIQFFADGTTDTIQFTSTGLATVSFDVTNKGVSVDTPSVGDGLIVDADELGVDNTVVRTAGNQTIAGIKTFDATIIGDINGNSGTATTLETPRNINGVPFDGSQDINVSTTQNLITGDGIIGGPFNGSTAVTIDVDSTVVRTSLNQTIGGLKTFTENITGNVIGDLTGNADTATVLETPRNINGVLFDGSQDITIPAQSSATPEDLTAGDGLSGGPFDGSTAVTIDVDSTVVRTSGSQTIDGQKIFSQDIIGNVFGNLAGNANTATVLETPRNINGVPFDGSQDITIPAQPSATPEDLITGDGIIGGPFDGSAAVTIDVDNTVVRTTGNQNIAGTKTFNDTLAVGSDYSETISTSTGNTTIDLANGTIFKITTNGNNTITLPSSAVGKSFTVFIEYTGDHSITWGGGSTLYWPEGNAPFTTSTAGAIDIFAFIQDGTNTYGLPSAQGMLSV